MEIYIVQPGDSIVSIANKYGLSVERLISDNGLINPNTLVTGQAIVILFPQTTYTVKEGDTLASIADSYGISYYELFRNNPFLFDRDFIYSGDVIVISYDHSKDIQLNGFTYAFITEDVLKRCLPYLTYISIFNYRISEDGNITTYYDDEYIIKTAMEYQTRPLLMISAFSPTGELDVESVYRLLLNEEKQDILVDGMLQLVKSKGFFGINALISNINETNQNLYIHVLTKLSNALRAEGFKLFLVMNPNLKKINDIPTYENLDYSTLSSIADRLIFIQHIWGVNTQPPAPISDISLLRPFIDNLTKIVSPNNISVGKPLIGYDWKLPFKTYANSLTLNSAIILAYDQQAVIILDEESQTPYYNYIKSTVGSPENHIVWFIDSRSFRALNDVILEYNLVGSGIWNIMSHNQQLFSMVNATFNIVKLF
jgi:spore germination protein